MQLIRVAVFQRRQAKHTGHVQRASMRAATVRTIAIAWIYYMWVNIADLIECIARAVPFKLCTFIYSIASVLTLN